MSEQDAVERLIGRINVLRDKAVDLTDRYAGDRYRETHGEDTPATFPEDYLYDALIEARIVLADAKKALEASQQENERLRKVIRGVHRVWHVDIYPFLSDILDDETLDRLNRDMNRALEEQEAQSEH